MLPIPVIRRFDVPIGPNKVMVGVALKRGTVFKVVRDKTKLTVEQKGLANTITHDKNLKINTTLSMELSN